MMPETFAERKEQWEGIVPDHLRSVLLFPIRDVSRRCMNSRNSFVHSGARHEEQELPIASHGRLLSASRSVRNRCRLFGTQSGTV